VDCSRLVTRHAPQSCWNRPVNPKPRWSIARFDNTLSASQNTPKSGRQIISCTELVTRNSASSSPQLRALQIISCTELVTISSVFWDVFDEICKRSTLKGSVDYVVVDYGNERILPCVKASHGSREESRGHL